MFKDFRTYKAAIRFFKLSETLKGSRHLLDQLHRAASSIPLNLAEGSERGTPKDRRRFFRMAMGSVRECQAILDLLPDSPGMPGARKAADELGALTFRLCQSLDQECKESTESGTRDQGPETR